MRHRIPIAVTPPEFFNNAFLKNELLSRYHHIKFNETNKPLSKRKFIDFVNSYQKIIIGNEEINPIILDKLPNLKTISKFGMDLSNLDINAIADHKIQLHFTSSFNKRAIAELTIGLMFNLLRHLTLLNSQTRQGDWHKMLGKQLSNRTIGIIGLGDIGKELAGLLQHFDCRILAFDLETNFAFCTVHGIRAMTIDQILTLSDIVSLHLPLNDKTYHLVNTEKLALMPSDSIIINASHPDLVVQHALYQHLSKNTFAGAAFDISKKEANFTKQLLDLDNFIAIPHIGSYTEETIINRGHSAIIGLETATVPRKASNF